MDEIVKRLEQIENRLQALEGRLSSKTGPVETSQMSQTPPPPPPAYVSEQTVPPAVSRPQEASHVESYIGRWILGVTGIVAILFGASFFLKYAFDSNLIGPGGRVMLGLVGGLLFVIVGEVLRGRYQKYSFIVSGGGLALFYLTIFSAQHFYGFINQTTALGFLSLVTAFGVVLAVWSDGLPLAMIAVFGGFLAPFLVSTGVSNDLGFFFYIGILTLGVLAVSFFRKWQALTLIGFIGMMINFSSWYGTYYTAPKLAFTMYILACFYVLYTLAGIVSTLVTKTKSNTADLFILTANVGWFFLWSYFLLYSQQHALLGFLAAALGALYIFFAYLASTTNPDDKNFILFLGALAVLFLTIAIPLELEQNAITIAWAVEAVILFFLGVSLKNQGMRMFASGVFLLALLRLFMFDSEAGSFANYIPVFNKRFFTYAMVILSSAILTYLAVGRKNEFTKQEKGTSAFFTTALNFLVLVVVTLEIYTFFNAKVFTLLQNEEATRQKNTPILNQPCVQYDYKGLCMQYGSSDYYGSSNYGNAAYNSSEYRSLMNQRNASISIFWGIYASILIVVGILYRVSFLRWSALILFGVTTGKVFIFDLAGLKTPYRILSFTVFGLILLAASYLYFRFEKRLKEDVPQSSQ